MSVVDFKKKMITSLARIVYSELVQQHHSCFALTGLDHVTVMITQDKSKNHPFFLKQIFTFFIVNSIIGIDLEKDIITCPVPYGGMLLLNNMIPHRR